jgi:hypothetical protein
MKIQMFAILDKMKPNTKYIRGLNLAVVNNTTVQVTRLPLKRELPKVGDDLLFPAWTDKGFVYIVQCYGLLTTSDHQLYRVTPLKMPFGFLIPFITISHT